VAEARFLRVVTFLPASSESAVDAALRERVLPALLETPGCLDAWIGRHGAGDRERLIAATWDRPAPEAIEQTVLAGTELDGGSPVITSKSVGSVAVWARFSRPEPGRLVRVFHGTAKPDKLEAYVADARRGMEADATVNSGLSAFVLARGGPDAFTTLSVWTDWASIEQATGGNVRRPATTRHADHLADYRITHYELLPADIRVPTDR